MPYTGTVTFIDNEANHPNGHFCLIGDDGKPYIAGVSDRGGASRIVVGSVESSLGDIFTVDEPKWQADLTTWLVDNGYTIPGTFFMGQGGFPVPGTPFFYVAGYQQFGGAGSTLAANCALCVWLRYRIVDISTLALDGVCIYKTGPSPAYEAMTNVNWGWCTAYIEGAVYAVAELAVGVVANIGGSGNTGIGHFLINLPFTGSVVDLIDNTWLQHVTRLGGNLFEWNSGENDRIEVALYKVPNGIGILSYQMPGENPNQVIGTSGSEYWEVSDSGVLVVNQADKRVDFDQPWDDSGTLYGGSPSGVTASYLDDYGAPIANPLEDGTTELIFGRTFSDDLTKARFRRYVHDPITDVYTFDTIYEATLSGIAEVGRGAYAFRLVLTDEFLAGVSWRSYQKWTVGSLEVPEAPDPCIPVSGYTDEDLPPDEIPCRVAWPYEILKPRNIGIFPVVATIGGGVPMFGNEQAIDSDIGFWQFTLDEIPIRSREQVLAWRKLEVSLEGRSGTICLPIYDGQRAPWVTPGDTIVASAASTFVIGGRSGSIKVTTGGTLEIGQHFSAGERLYRLVDVSDPTGDPPIYPVEIWPKIRTTISIDDPLEFGHPICKCRLEQDDGMSVDLILLRWAIPTVSFIEDI